MKINEILVEKFITGRENVERGIGYKQYRDSEDKLHLEVLAKTCDTCGGSGRRNTGGTIQRGNSDQKMDSRKGLNKSRACNRCDGLGVDTSQLFYGTFQEYYDVETYAGTDNFHKDFNVMYNYIVDFKDSDAVANRAYSSIVNMGAVNYQLFSKLSNGALSSTKVSLGNGSTDVRFSPPRKDGDEIRPDDIITHTSGEKDKITKDKAAADKKANRKNIAFNVGKKTKDELKQQDPDLYQYLYSTYNGGNAMIDKVMKGLDVKGSISKKGYNDLYRFANNELNK